MDDWFHTETNCPATGVESADTVTHLSTNRARRRLTSLIETNSLTTTPNRQLVCITWRVGFQETPVEAKSARTQGMSSGRQVASILLARYYSSLPQHLRLDLGALRTAALARPLPRSDTSALD